MGAAFKAAWDEHDEADVDHHHQDGLSDPEVPPGVDVVAPEGAQPHDKLVEGCPCEAPQHAQDQEVEELVVLVRTKGAGRHLKLVPGATSYV